MLGSTKYKKEIKEHIHVKKAVYSKDGTIFDFMICPPNDELEVVKSSLLDIPELKVKLCDDTNSETNQTEFELVEELLRKASIEGFNLLYPSESSPNIFPLKRKKYSRAEVYEAIQSTVAYIQLDKPVWILKHRDPENGLYFSMGAELKLANFKINITDLPQPNTDFFNLFLGFLTKPVMEINKEIMDSILWHTKNIISAENVKLHEYLWKWWAFLVQKLAEKSRTILVLKSTLQQCRKNIITDFIGDKVLGEYLHFATLDLKKILECFNSTIQARKFIVINEIGMSSGEWHKFNGHLKSLITEGRNTSIKIDIGDSSIVCFDVSPHCRRNTKYFKRLGNILNHPDAPGIVMKYLLNLNISDFDPQEIPATKLKSDIMRDQLPNPIQFIINHISPWCEDKVSKPSCTLLYQNYVEWYGENGKKLFNSAILGKKFSQIGIN
ncbi:highly derived D5-like helicase-primase [Rhizophagus clarus]|uniref:Highly derived D5-like helicase-primase n=1 Tax=Rhizophagus clarus TaxID=94130 RepID=A0A8H3KXA3_9GLOM|nr:highly derived D5-like helicase-primase [Rhizophagus clarus]